MCWGRGEVWGPRRDRECVRQVSVWGAALTGVKSVRQEGGAGAAENAGKAKQSWRAQQAGAARCAAAGALYASPARWDRAPRAAPAGMHPGSSAASRQPCSFSSHLCAGRHGIPGGIRVAAGANHNGDAAAASTAAAASGHAARRVAACPAQGQAALRCRQPSSCLPCEHAEHTARLCQRRGAGGVAGAVAAGGSRAAATAVVRRRPRPADLLRAGAADAAGCAASAAAGAAGLGSLRSPDARALRWGALCCGSYGLLGEGIRSVAHTRGDLPTSQRLQV